jgi:hypothetical protein
MDVPEHSGHSGQRGLEGPQSWLEPGIRSLCLTIVPSFHRGRRKSGNRVCCRRISSNCLHAVFPVLVVDIGSSTVVRVVAPKPTSSSGSTSTL